MNRLSIILAFLFTLGFLACENATEKITRTLEETKTLSAEGDSLLADIKQEIRIINNHIAEMVDLGVERDLLGSYVDAYKQKERKFKNWSGQWKEIKGQIFSAASADQFQGDAEALKTSGQALNDSLLTLKKQMMDISTQAVGILENAKKSAEETPADQ